jgi:hypothetical protein
VLSKCAARTTRASGVLRRDHVSEVFQASVVSTKLQYPLLLYATKAQVNYGQNDG